MTREFSLLGFVEHLGHAAAEARREAHHALERAAVLVEAEAKAEIGHYQDEARPFVAWAELAESTKADRVAQGFPADEPLLRTGDMRDSIHHKVEMTGSFKGEAMIGSDSPIAEYQELGTSRIPPRSFLGGALVRKSHEVVHILGAGVVKGLIGEEVAGGYLPIA